MRRTSFRNASGLPNRRQLSTVRDMALLAQSLVRDFPRQYHYFARRNYSFRGKVFKNHNNLLRTYPGTDGIKTGYIRASGFNLAASVTRDGRRLIGVVFGGRTAKSRDQHMAKLLERGFAKIGTKLSKPTAIPLKRPALTKAAANSKPQKRAATAPTGSKKRAPSWRNTYAALTSQPAAEEWAIQVGAYWNI